MPDWHFAMAYHYNTIVTLYSMQKPLHTHGAGRNHTDYLCLPHFTDEEIYLSKPEILLEPAEDVSGGSWG